MLREARRAMRIEPLPRSPRALLASPTGGGPRQRQEYVETDVVAYDHGTPTICLAGT